MIFLGVNIADLLELTVPPLELFIRGTLMFWFLFLIFRLVLRRDVGSASITDFLFIVILGDAAQNAMIGDGNSVGDGMVLIASLVLWNVALDFLSYRFRFIEKLLSAEKLCLVRDGKLQRKNMRKEFVTVAEVNEKVRGAGLERLDQVKFMYMESDGEISIIKHKKT